MNAPDLFSLIGEELGATVARPLAVLDAMASRPSLAIGPVSTISDVPSTGFPAALSSDPTEESPSANGNPSERKRRRTVDDGDAVLVGPVPEPHGSECRTSAMETRSGGAERSHMRCECDAVLTGSPVVQTDRTMTSALPLGRSPGKTLSVDTAGALDPPPRDQDSGPVPPGTTTSALKPLRAKKPDVVVFRYSSGTLLIQNPRQCAELIRQISGGPDDMPSVGDLLFSKDYEEACHAAAVVTFCPLSCFFGVIVRRLLIDFAERWPYEFRDSWLRCHPEAVDGLCSSCRGGVGKGEEEDLRVEDVLRPKSR